MGFLRRLVVTNSHAGITKRLAFFRKELPRVGMRRKNDFEHAEGVRIAHFAVVRRKAQRIVAPAAGAHHDFANAVLGIGLAVRILRRETLVGMFVTHEHQVRMSGTFIPMYGVNNVFGQIPIFGQLLGGGSNEGLFGITYEVVGSPGQPVLRVNPMSAIFPGVFRKIMEFNTGKQNNQIEFPNN